MLNNVGLKGKRVAVTGGGGFLGRHLLSQLLEAGAEVTCLARPSSRTVFPKDVRHVYGDCLERDSLIQLVNAQDIVIHMAATLFARGWQDYLAANSGAAQNIASACLTSGAENLERVIFVSSLAACGPCAVAPGLNERARPRPVSAYGWSKYCSEKILSSLGERLVIVRPPIIYGSGDKGLLPLFRSIRKTGIGISPGLGREFPVSVIHAADAALAILLACSKKASGIYHLSDAQPVEMSGFCRAIAAAFGRRALVLHPPLSVMGMTAALSSLWGVLAAKLNLARRPPSWNMDKFREAREAGWLADSGRIRQELGFVPQMTLQRGLEETVAGYAREGWL